MSAWNHGLFYVFWLAKQRVKKNWDERKGRAYTELKDRKCRWLWKSRTKGAGELFLS